ncbi:hypothetical protein LSAT2_010388 [Lamellibrachia satsuma]|nr:hypothetical protein LSAT2_010388 [Lamellibrachia satsuma]
MSRIHLLKGHPDYEISSVSAGEVTAATLNVLRFNEASLPLTVEAVLTTEDAARQYQLKTVISKPITYRLDKIDSPVWLAIPPPTWSFTGQDKLTVECTVEVPNERKFGFNNELKLLRLEKAKDDDTGNSLLSVAVLHKDMEGPLAEQYSNIIIFGERRKTPLNRTTYGIKMSAVNNSHAYAGLYVCAFERRHDKMYAVSLMKLAGSPPPLPHAPTAAIKSCSAENYDKEKQELTMSYGVDTCLRCEGTGTPAPSVALYRGSTEVNTSAEIGVTKYINVAAAGIAEASYTFRSPSNQVEGQYSCRVANDFGSDRVEFMIVFRNSYLVTRL